MVVDSLASTPSGELYAPEPQDLNAFQSWPYSDNDSSAGTDGTLGFPKVIKIQSQPSQL